MILLFDRQYEFLSNFYESPFTVDGVTYKTNEHWFQAWKTLDETEFANIVAAATPGQSKHLGRYCTLRPDWEKVKTDVMMEGLRHKFSNPDLRQKLLDTGDEELVEGNFHHDNTWGDCLCSECKNKIGRNLLGMLLMELRKELRYEEAKS